jgi:hypothetical protein
LLVASFAHLGKLFTAQVGLTVRVVEDLSSTSALFWITAGFASAAVVFLVFPVECGSALLCRFGFSCFAAVVHSPEKTEKQKRQSKALPHSKKGQK